MHLVFEMILIFSIKKRRYKHESKYWTSEKNVDLAQKVETVLKEREINLQSAEKMVAIAERLVNSQVDK